MSPVRPCLFVSLLAALLALPLAPACSSRQADLQTNRVIRRGRTQSASRFTESVGRNRIRVVAFDFGGVSLGQCATPEGDLLWESCLTGKAEAAEENIRIYSNDSDDGMQEGSARNTRSSESKRLDMNSGMFRQYSIQVDTDASFGGTGVASVSGKGKLSTSRHILVFEWRRYLLQGLSIAVNIQRPFVSALERGVAVRVVFDVTLRTQDAELSASFGFGSLATALARGSAEVEVGYELIGTTMDILPDRATNITSVDGYIEAMNRFYDAVRRVSMAWRCYTEAKYPSLSGTGPGVPSSNQPSEECDPAKAGQQAVRDSMTFQAGILAYYVTGVRSDTVAETSSFMQGYMSGLEGIAQGQSCKQIQDASHSPKRPRKPPDMQQFDLGLQQAIMDVRGSGAWCTEAKPTGKEQRAAQASLNG